MIINDIRQRATQMGLMRNEQVISERQKLIIFSLQGLTTGSPIYFNPDPQLTDSKIVALEVVNDTQLSNTPIRSYQDISDPLTSALLAQGQFFAANIKRKVIFECGLASLVSTDNGGRRQMLSLETIWQNCGVYFNDTTGITPGTNSIAFRVYYDPK